MHHHNKRIWDNHRIDLIIQNKKFHITRISDCFSKNDIIKLKCNKCHHLWETKPLFLNNCKKYGCPKCANIIKLTNEIVDERIKDRNISRLESYVNARNPMRWRCNVCKHEWVSSADNIMRGKGCASCAGQLNITNEYVDEKLKINNPKIVRIGNIINCKILCEFKCIECNHIWKAIPQNVYRNKHTSGCPKCLYKRERYVHDVILKHIPTTFVKYQHKIKDNLSNFIVDFYIFINNKNIFIEYNGEQHYRPFRFKNKDYVDILI
jgi:predicted  nucleic acid-binding Zn-ribbon protein